MFHRQDSLAASTADRLTGQAHEMRERGSARMARLTEQAQDLLHRGTDAVRDRSHQLSSAAWRASDTTRTYIRDEPFKAVLIAAAAGAAIVAIAEALSRRH